MGFREHIFNLLTRTDIPFRHPVFQHIFLILRPLFTFSFCDKSFTDTLHNCKGFLTIQPFINQVRHNIISCTNCRRNRCLSFLNQRLCIVKPYVRPVGKTGNTNQVRNRLRLRIHNHLNNKIRSKLRNTKTAYRTTTNIFRLNSKNLRPRKKRHDIRII